MATGYNTSRILNLEDEESNSRYVSESEDEPDDPVDDGMHLHMSEDQIYASDEDAAVQRISEQQSPLFQRPVKRPLPSSGSAGTIQGGSGGGNGIRRPMGLLRQDTPSPKAITGRKGREKKVQLEMVIDKDAPVILSNGDDDSPDGPPNMLLTRVKGNEKVSTRHSTGEALGSDSTAAVTPKRASAPSRSGLKRPSGGATVGSGMGSSLSTTKAEMVAGGAEPDRAADALPKRVNRSATTIEPPADEDPDGPPLPNFADPRGGTIGDHLEDSGHEVLDPDGPELPSFGRSGGRSGRGGCASADDSGGDPDGPELPNFGSFGVGGGDVDGDDLMDADDEHDMDVQAGSRTRSRSSSFYNVGVDDDGGEEDDLSQDEFDKMMEEASRSGRTRSSSTLNGHDQESIIAGSSIQGKRKSLGYAGEGSPLRALKEREKRALEEGLEDAANQVRMAGRADRARASLPGARVTAGAIVDFDAVDSPVRRDSTSSLSDNESSYLNGNGTSTWKYDRKIKMLMLGDVGVGKTALMTRWTEDAFHADMISTAGVDYKSRVLTLDDKCVQVQVWDTAGQERFHVITHSYYRGCNAILLVYDVSEESDTDFERLEYWLEKVKSHASTNCEVALLCNKIDIFEGKTPSELAQESKIAGAKKVAEAEGIEIFLTSAKSGAGVEEAYNAVVSKAMDKQNRGVSVSSKASGEERRSSERDSSASAAQTPAIKGCGPRCSIM